MWKENLYQQVEILLREHDEFPIGEHQHSFFEMAYILEGSGTFYAYTMGSERECHTYEAGDLFLIPPNRIHLYTIRTHSRYVFIRFTENYVFDSIGHYLERALEIRSGFRMRLVQNDCESIRRLMVLLVEEASSKRALSEMLLSNYVNSLILLTVRALDATATETGVGPEGDKARNLLLYIGQHIDQPDELRLGALAARFQLSPTYIGRFFKRNFGEDFRLYVSKNRLKRVEELLTSTRMSVKEIASRMGYIDSCYLNKLFRQHHGMTPMDYRKAHTPETGGYQL